MTRIRTLILLLPLILLSQTPQIVHAAPQAPTTNWKPGTYGGAITIKATDHHPTPKDVKGKEEYTLYITRTTGTLTILIGPKGNIQFKFEIPISFTQADWVEGPDYGQGNCRGQVSDSHGYTKVTYSGAPTLTPVSNYFTTVGVPKLSKVVFGKPTIYTIGPNCGKTDEGALRKGVGNGLKSAMENQIDFIANPPNGNRITGACKMFGWENDKERTYTCSWFVRRPPTKK